MGLASGRPTGLRKKRGTGQDSEPAGSHKHVVVWASPQAYIKYKKKNLYLCILIFLMDFCINIPNSCITGKDKYYVFF